MKKWCLFGIILILSFMSIACSNEDSTESSEDSNAAADREMVEESRDEMGEAKNEFANNTEPAQHQATEEVAEQTDESRNQSSRKVIYTGNLSIEVNNYNNTINEIQSQVNQSGGYIVESQTYGGGEKQHKEGRIKVRIPQEYFHDFVKVIEQGSMTVVEKTITGQDVTEEFVDLESRLESKRVVEKRLLSFMEDAEKTEDLLKISNDLANIQEEIERLTGRINYLQNQTDLATITIHIIENNVSINKENLDTWDKTKQKLVKSVNTLIVFVSSLFIFIIGNLPILIPIAIISFIGYRYYRKKYTH